MGVGMQKVGSGRGGFTLIECALTMVIIGVGTVGMLQLMAAGTMSNAESSEMLTGLNLANHIREMSRGMKFADPTTPSNWGSESGEATATYDDLDDLDAKTFQPPIDARRQSLSDYSSWKQVVTVETMNPSSISTATTKGSQPFNRLTVKLYKNGNEVCQLSWLISKTS